MCFTRQSANLYLNAFKKKIAKETWEIGPRKVCEEMWFKSSSSDEDRHRSSRYRARLIDGERTISLDNIQVLADHMGIRYQRQNSINLWKTFLFWQLETRSSLNRCANLCHLMLLPPREKRICRVVRIYGIQGSFLHVLHYIIYAYLLWWSSTRCTSIIQNIGGYLFQNDSQRTN